MIENPETKKSAASANADNPAVTTLFIKAKPEKNKPHPQPTFDYPSWGLAETKSSEKVTAVLSLDATKTEHAIEILRKQVDLTGYKLKAAGQVDHYQGNNSSSAKLAWLRFEREDQKNAGLNCEHISATVDIASGRIMGLTRMQANLTGEAFVNHQFAFKQAVDFLKTVAPDLIPADFSCSLLSEQKPGTRMSFPKPTMVGNVELHWINDHKENIKADNKDVEVHGMKLKMYIPATQLWAWVVVDKKGQVETFERNIFWNFKEFRRETQMWLHDNWLEAQKIKMLEPTTNIKPGLTPNSTS